MTPYIQPLVINFPYADYYFPKRVRQIMAEADSYTDYELAVHIFVMAVSAEVDLAEQGN